MRRAYWIYTMMAVALVAGLWVILAVGANVQAPADLAGRWELIPIDERNAAPAEMLVEQSGRYFQLRLGAQESYRLELAEQRRFDAQAAHQLFVRIANGDIVAEFRGPYRGKIYELRLEVAGQSRRWTALWVERTYRRLREPDTSLADTDAPG